MIKSKILKMLNKFISYLNSIHLYDSRSPSFDLMRTHSSLLSQFKYEFPKFWLNMEIYTALGQVGLDVC